MLLASTITRSQSNSAPLECGEWWGLHWGSAADKSTATQWCYHVNVNQNLGGMFPATWISAMGNWGWCGELLLWINLFNNFLKGSLRLYFRAFQLITFISLLWCLSFFFFFFLFSDTLVPKFSGCWIQAIQVQVKVCKELLPERFM